MSDMPNDVPDDSVGGVVFEMPSHLDGIAIQLYEMRESLLRAGFNEKESMQLIGYAISAGIMEPYFDEGPRAHVSIEDEDGFDDDNFDDGHPV